MWIAIALAAAVSGWYMLDWHTRRMLIVWFWTLLIGASLAGSILTVISGGRLPDFSAPDGPPFSSY